MLYQITVPWIIFPVLALLAFAAGALTVSKVGVKWAAALAYWLHPDDMAALAGLLWDADVVPAMWKRLRYGNDRAKFVESVRQLYTEVSDALLKMDNAAEVERSAVYDQAWWRKQGTESTPLRNDGHTLVG